VLSEARAAAGRAPELGHRNRCAWRFFTRLDRPQQRTIRPEHTSQPGALQGSHVTSLCSRRREWRAAWALLDSGFTPLCGSCPEDLLTASAPWACGSCRPTRIFVDLAGGDAGIFSALLHRADVFWISRRPALRVARVILMVRCLGRCIGGDEGRFTSVCCALDSRSCLFGGVLQALQAQAVGRRSMPFSF